MDGLALLLCQFDPGGGEGEGVDVVGLVGVGLGEACAEERLGGVGYSPSIEGFYNTLQDIKDVVSVCLGCGLYRRADSVLGGDSEDDGGFGEAVEVSGLGVLDVVEVDKAAGPLHRGLWEVELVPVLVDVTECRYHGGKPVLDCEENLFHGANGFYGLNGLFVKGFRDFFCYILLNGGGQFRAFADEATLGDADVIGASGIVGALVMGGGVWQVAFDGYGTVAGDELNGTSEVASGAGENLALTGCTSGLLEAAFDFLPGAAKEALLLEILLEHTDGEVTQFLWQVAFQLSPYGGFNALEVVAKVLNFHDYKKVFCQFQKRLYLCILKIGVCRKVHAALNRRKAVSYFIVTSLFSHWMYSSNISILLL